MLSAIKSFVLRLRPAKAVAWSEANERELLDRKARHERTGSLEKAKRDAKHAELAREVWGRPAPSRWRGVAR